MDTIDINNLQQALNENNIQSKNKSSLSSSAIRISGESGNALTMKDDGLYLNSMGNKIESVNNLFNNKIWGKYVIGDCDYYISLSDTKYSQLITIPLNLIFTPKLFFIYFDYLGGGTGSTYMAKFNRFAISNVRTNDLRLQYVSDYDGDWAGLGVHVSIKSFGKDNAAIRIESYKETKTNCLYGTEAASKVGYKITKWIAIG